MTDKTYKDVAAKQDQLIRKALEGSVFIGAATATAVTSLTVDSTGAPGTPTLAALPVGYTDLGWTDDTGATFSNAVTTSDVTSWGSVEPTRRDITADLSTMHVVCQETKLATISAFTGVAPAAITADATTAEVGIAKPTRPTTVYHRLLVLGVDQGDAGEIYVAQFWPRAALTDKGDQVLAGAGSEYAWDTTWTAFQDPALGYAVKWLFGGPGWQALKTAMGLGS